ncbi:MAG TPA: DUF3618 domain-containing protein [Thermoanaerobaculia bacterium]|nr:DUF3618 domain-containing protein [Thermoanaerobaculia bacterium]
MGERTDSVSGHDRTDELRRDIERTQREMSRTIDEIQHRLSPHYMMERTKDSMREAGVNASRGLMDKVRDNPIPAAMVGVGLFLLMRDSGHDDRYDVEFIPERSGWDTTGTHYSSVSEYRDLESGEGRMAEAKDRVQSAMSSAREATSEKLDAAADRARRLGTKARSRMSRARYQSRDVLAENPLIAGLAALAAGAIIGALIPETEKEHELMGDTRDRLAERAKDMARDGVSRAKDVATSAATAATEAAKSEVKSQQQSRTERTDIGQNIGIGDRPI